MCKKCISIILLVVFILTLASCGYKCEICCDEGLVPCFQCGGAGNYSCPTCEGKGTVTQSENEIDCVKCTDGKTPCRICTSGKMDCTDCDQ